MSLNIPFVMMLVLTMIVWVMLYVRRIGWMLKEGVDAQELATRRDRHKIPEHVDATADNFQNLFELPVIFYALCLYLAWGNEVGVMTIVLAYIFVASRFVHSFIQCSYNRVIHRFWAYVIGAVALWVMVIQTLWGIVFY